MEQVVADWSVNLSSSAAGTYKS